MYQVASGDYSTGLSSQLMVFSLSNHKRFPCKKEKVLFFILREIYIYFFASILLSHFQALASRCYVKALSI